MTNLNDELSIDQLDIACGGAPGDHNGTGPHTGKHDGLGWLRNLAGAIGGAISAVAGALGSIIPH